MENLLTSEESIEEFYNQYFYFSYSSLNKLLDNPSLFYNIYVLKNKIERVSSSLIEGSLIHCLLFERDTLENNFIMVPGKIPSGTAKEIVEHVYKSTANSTLHAHSELTDFESDILSYLKQINLHQRLTSDEARVAKVITQENTDYFNFLRDKSTKKVIDLNTLLRCENTIQIIQANERISKLLQLGESSYQVENELILNMELDSYSFGLKGIIDNLVIDHSNKMVYINDFKTTSKSLKEFEDSVSKYKYWLQAAVYCRLVYHNYNLRGYKFHFSFVVIDKYKQIYPFFVKSTTMEKWLKDLDEVLVIANYHYLSRDFELPYEFSSHGVYL